MSTDEPRVRGDLLGRADRAWQMRVSGGSWATIARETGYSNGENCARAVKSVYGQLPTPTRADLRDLWRARLETLWMLALSDAHEHRPGAVVSGVRVGQLAVQLDGLAEPVRVDATLSGVWAETFKELNDAGFLGS